MTTIAWFGILVLVAVAAFIAGTQLTKKRFKHDELEQKAQEAQHALEQYRQDVSDHLADSKKLMAKLEENYTLLNRHFEDGKQLLSQEKSTPSEPFFSKETTEQLHASLHMRGEKRRANEQTHDAPPSDYVEGESGLFKGEGSQSEQLKAS
ncbi:MULTISPECIES: YhcB family protein [Pseudoalteromonas]|uniref:Z-ring associated protein G n=1 Tax=Pseudoalteromonas rubra TaxID=43658 RepID=A0A0L0EXN2_9GAMM|nr:MULTISPECIES: DUF1043 family protein [Pseudoalteromonas]KNC69211.1 hypothetical protein AC626_00255 [Pseudoalteromonas rubra]MDK1311842.1 DUF1043 family protein [Pseudoalteromonas sp. R96]